MLVVLSTLAVFHFLIDAGDNGRGNGVRGKGETSVPSKRFGGFVPLSSPKPYPVPDQNFVQFDTLFWTRQQKSLRVSDLACKILTLSQRFMFPVPHHKI